MTTTLTLVDDTYSANDTTGRKRLFASLSLLRPSTAGGDAISISGYFPNKFLGGKMVGINPNVSIAGASACALGHFRADNTSTATVIFQVFSVGLSGTASVGALVDNTASYQSATCFVELVGR